jgi:ketosteroid isomerase-like protein
MSSPLLAFFDTFGSPATTTMISVRPDGTGIRFEMTERATGAERATAWIAAYERGWRRAGTESLDRLFTKDATYRPAPYAPTIAGLGAIAEMWEAERDGPDERFTMSSELVAVDGSVAVARVEVLYEDPEPQEYRDLWIIRFADDGRCEAFEEWPFWPGQPLGAPGDR